MNSLFNENSEKSCYSLPLVDNFMYIGYMKEYPLASLPECGNNGLEVVSLLFLGRQLFLWSNNFEIHDVA